MPSIVAIHQPNFFPWLGYFDKMRRAEHFVFLDDVQFPKTGGVWTNRVKICIAGKARWLTAPVDRNYTGLRMVHEMRFSASKPWRDDMLRSIESAYRKAQYYDEAMALLIPLIAYEEDGIAAYNIHAITALASQFALRVKFHISSDLASDGKATARLIQLTRAVGGDAYLCGGGADGYQQDEAFAEAGIRLVYQDFISQPYPQGGADFMPGLSVIDMLMHLGVDATAQHIRGEP
jgi:hypothetical protein